MSCSMKNSPSIASILAEALSAAMMRRIATDFDDGRNGARRRPGIAAPASMYAAMARYAAADITPAEICYRRHGRGARQRHRPR